MYGLYKEKDQGMLRLVDSFTFRSMLSQRDAEPDLQCSQTHPACHFCISREYKCEYYDDYVSRRMPAGDSGLPTSAGPTGEDNHPVLSSEDPVEGSSPSHDAPTESATISSAPSLDRDIKSDQPAKPLSTVACNNCRMRNVRVSLISQSCRHAVKQSLTQIKSVLQCSGTCPACALCVGRSLDCEYIEEPIERAPTCCCPDRSTDALVEGKRIGTTVSSGPTESLSSKHDASSVAATGDVSGVEKRDSSVGNATSF